MVDAVTLLKRLRKPSVKAVESVEAIKEEKTQPIETNPMKTVEKSMDSLCSRLISFPPLPGDWRDYAIDVTIEEDPSGHWASGTGGTLWDCSIALTECLLADQGLLQSCTGCLEIGAGLGLPSIALSKAIKAKIIATDRLLMLPLLHRAIAANQSPSDSDSPSITCHCLDWNDPHGVTAACSHLQRELGEKSSLINVIIGSDLFFPANRSDWPNIAASFGYFLHCYTGSVGYLAHEVRNAVLERDFFALLEEARVAYEAVSLPSTPHDIRIYRLTAIR